MNSVIEFIGQPWPWYVGGPLISLVMFLLLFYGKKFGLSSNLKTMCSIAGAGKVSDFFNFNWRDQIWNLVFALGTLLGGFIASNFLTPDDTIGISEATKTQLLTLGFENPGQGYIPTQFISFEALSTIQGWLMIVGGGLLVGFGTRYANGCTSGHAISGLSDLQIPSLIAVIGFFVGGLIMTHLLLPIILTL